MEHWLAHNGPWAAKIIPRCQALRTTAKSSRIAESHEFAIYLQYLSIYLSIYLSPKQITGTSCHMSQKLLDCGVTFRNFQPQLSISPSPVPTLNAPPPCPCTGRRARSGCSWHSSGSRTCWDRSSHRRARRAGEESPFGID